MSPHVRLLVASGLAAGIAGCASSAAPEPIRTPGPSPAALPAAPRPRPPLRALIVGGGPERAHNEVAIESNVRYVGRLLPPGAGYRVLFADGSADTPSVQYRVDSRRLAYRAPNVPRLDGAATLPVVHAELGAVAEHARRAADADLLIYFTGHGSPSRPTRFANNWFSLWGNARFTVTELARALDGFPDGAPVTLVMVQCFSGAFGNVLFEGGDPQGALVEQRLAGFFAAVPERLAAGCTPAINEAEYRDFTSYFFAALTGVDRVGRVVTGADYDADGRVGMHEAFAWTLIHDDSIDTPVCTSDTFLRRFVQLADAEVAATPYATLRSWATPAQRAALDGLSDAIRLTGDDRLRGAFARAARLRPDTSRLPEVRLMRFVYLARTVVLAHALNQSDDLAARRRYAEILSAESRNPLRPGGD